jgi:2-polyprenyl-6-hydroxyphenyl methylase/3-demethylubiquinone-9 3-methyltransferase
MSAVELGGGGSTHSLLAALKGTRSTVVDYSAEAERVVRERCRIAGIQVQFLRLDALALPAAVEAGFDLAWSFGTAEHFTGADRLAFIRAHARAVRPGGLVIISVPNRSALNYRVWMYLAQKAGEWPFGLEVPFSREELRRSLQSSGLRLVGIDAYAGRPCTAKTLGIIRRHWPLFFPIASLLVWFGKRLPSRLQQLLTQRDLVAIGLKEVTSSAATVP